MEMKSHAEKGSYVPKKVRKWCQSLPTFKCVISLFFKLSCNLFFSMKFITSTIQWCVCKSVAICRKLVASQKTSYYNILCKGTIVWVMASSARLSADWLLGWHGSTSHTLYPAAWDVSPFSCAHTFRSKSQGVNRSKGAHIFVVTVYLISNSARESHSLSLDRWRMKIVLDAINWV